MIWLAVAVTCVGCWALKAAGLLVPASLLEHPAARTATALIPGAMLAALVLVQTVADGQALVVDARLAALGVAAVGFALRVPFLLVVVAAAATAAGLRAL